MRLKGIAMGWNGNVAVGLALRPVIADVQVRRPTYVPQA